jgi:hypothetical protein
MDPVHSAETPLADQPTQGHGTVTDPTLFIRHPSRLAALRPASHKLAVDDRWWSPWDDWRPPPHTSIKGS